MGEGAVAWTGVARPSPLASFRVRSYRFQWPADLLTSWAFEMETLILGWYVLVETDSVVMLTLFASLQYLGTLVAPMFGVAGDRIGHRSLLCGMRATYTALAATLAALALAGLLAPLHVFCIAALSGMVRPSDLAMRGALIAETMPRDQLMGGMSISRTTQDSARVVGTLTGAGAFAALGIGPAYLLVTGFYLGGLLLTFGVSRSGAARQPGGIAPAPPVATSVVSPWRALTDGIAYVWNTPTLLASMMLAFLVNLTAFPITSGLMPYVAKEVYRVGQAELGYLVASFAFGALCGSIVQSLAGAGPGRRILLAAAAWYGMLLVFLMMPGPYSGMLALAAAGFAQSLSMVPLAVLVLSTSDERYRGRVMGVRMLAIYSLPLGLLAAGALIERIGYTTTALLYCGTGLVFTLLIGLRWRTALWRAPGLPAAPRRS